MELNQLKELMEAFSQSAYLECRLVTSEVSLELKRTDVHQGQEPSGGMTDVTGLSAAVQAGAAQMSGRNPMAGAAQMPGGNPMAGGSQMTGNHQAGAMVQAAGTAGSSGQTQDNGADWKVVKAPMAGTFYTSAKPGEEPYVTAGSRVSKGDTLGLLEAMKVISEITAPVSGTVQEVLLEDAQFAEYDMPLFRIRET
ncbi:MAG: hypothetical protein IJG17_02350 [Eubacterium sp.]|nr:hypothetical protein [Eubacterium sp.]